MCCPDCKRCGGIEHDESKKAHCRFCNWTGDQDSLIVDNDEFKYHDHEPGID